jgi:glutamate/aspartate transport system substrate-binding protein
MKTLVIAMILKITWALCALCSLSVQAQTSDTLKKIKESGTITLGGREASFPFSYVTGPGHPIGFSADLCLKVVDAVKAKLNMPQLKVEYQIVTPANRIPLVQNGTVDLECSTTTNTVVRGKDVEFAPTHFVAGVGAAVKKSSGITTFSQFDGKTVATTTGSTSIQLLRTYRKTENINIQELSGKDISDAFLLLASDRTVALILDDVQLAALIANALKPDDYVILRERLREEPYGFMYRKNDPEFKTLVDQTVTNLMKTGQINDVYAKWFTKPVPPKSVNLNFPMSDLVREAYRNPNNKGI